MSTGVTRRGFIQAGIAGAGTARLGAAVNPAPAANQTAQRRFYMVLSLGRIGFSGTFAQSVELAVKQGFEGVDPDTAYFQTLSDDGMERLLDNLESRKLKLGAAGLPVEFRKDEASFSDGLKKLPAFAKLMQRARVQRVNTWINPASDNLTYLQNFRTHAYRLRACAQVLADHGENLGLEYVAPRTLWRSGRQPFIHTMSETKELLVAIGFDNLGLQLDSWHWYNAEDTKADILNLRSKDILAVDLNDAPAGVSRDQLLDDHRELPAATGVIPVKDFLSGLVEIGYDGPIQAEPFNAALRAMPIDEACAAAAAAIGKAFALAGIA